MQKTISTVLMVCLYFLTSNIYAQNLQKSKFIIITFEDDYSKSFHGIQRYFWVIPIDSIKSFQNILYPIYLSSYSKSHLNDCILGKSIDPSIPSLKPGDRDFDSLWNASHNTLDELIFKKRKLVQTIKKIWSNGNKETISIYATPIITEFCSCNFMVTTQTLGVYDGKIFLAGNFSEGYNEFWKSDLASFVLKQDYSRINFIKMRYPGD